MSKIHRSMREQKIMKEMAVNLVWLRQKLREGEW